MLNNVFRPSSLDGIKRLAKEIKYKQGLQHTEALNVASAQAGYQNFNHARNVLANTVKAVPQNHRHLDHKLYLTCYWKDRSSGDSGRETLKVTLSMPWRALITPAQLKKHVRDLASFRDEGPDHLSRQYVVQSQSEARRHVCAAARVFQFMEATGLRPSSGHSRAYPRGSSINAIPGMDHSSVWYDPQAKRYLLADEPYEKAAESKSIEREEWAKRHGFVVLRPDWKGMYAPYVDNGGSRLYLIAHEIKGIPLKPVVEALNRLPPPVRESNWQGESAPRWPNFTSPGVAENDNRQREVSKPKTSSRAYGSRNSVAYEQTLVGPQRRPNGRMPIAAHEQAGQLLKSVLINTRSRRGVYKKIDSVRSELDEWVQREYDHSELGDDQFFALYYKESGTTFPKVISQTDREQHERSLQQVKEILANHYPESAPLKGITRKLDAAINSLRKWT